tara:strand:+ start:1029 stop:1472 length:444 start_codon:yes stop_codon:yes gene_type:complete
MNTIIKNKTKVIFICTGNSCRSQMAEGLLKHMSGDHFEVFSAGSHPSRVHPASILVMDEIGIDISNHSAEAIDKYLDKKIDTVITVCDNARLLCPVFPGNVHRIHWSIEDPFHGWSTEPSDLIPYRETRNILKDQIKTFINQRLSKF